MEYGMMLSAGVGNGGLAAIKENLYRASTFDLISLLVDGSYCTALLDDVGELSCATMPWVEPEPEH